MSQKLEISPDKSSSSLPELAPSVSKAEYGGLGRSERIYNAVMFPRHFQLSNQDADYLELMKRAYNILLTSATDQGARRLISEIKPGSRLALAEVIELIRCTKEFFGKIEVRNVEFDRMVQRQRLIDLYNRCKIANDLFNERLTLHQIERLDSLALKEKEESAPQVPPLPNVTFTPYEDAIIESMPTDEEE